MEYNQESFTFKTIKEAACKAQQIAKSALLYESETDQQKYRKFYDKLSSSSKPFNKSKNYESLAKPKSNRIAPFQQQEQQQPLPNKCREQRSGRKNITSTHLLQSNSQFWKERHNRTKVDKFCEKAWRQKYQTAESPLCIKQGCRKNMKMPKVLINRVGFNDIFPRQNCFYGKKVGKDLHKRKSQFQQTHKKVCAIQKISPQSNETFTMEIKKIAKPSVRMPSHSLPLKIEDKIEDFIIESSKKIRLSYKNQGKYIHQEYHHKFKHKKHRSDTFLMALSRPKITQEKTVKDNNSIQNSIENRYNLANIFRKLKQLRNAVTIETQKPKQSQSSQQKQPKLIEFEHTLSDKVIYSDKANQKSKAMKNDLKVCTQNAKQSRDMLQIERMIQYPHKRLLSQIYFNDQFNSQ